MYLPCSYMLTVFWYSLVLGCLSHCLNVWWFLESAPFVYKSSIVCTQPLVSSHPICSMMELFRMELLLVSVSYKSYYIVHVHVFEPVVTFRVVWLSKLKVAGSQENTQKLLKEAQANAFSCSSDRVFSYQKTKVCLYSKPSSADELWNWCLKG